MSLRTMHCHTSLLGLELKQSLVKTEGVLLLNAADEACLNVANEVIIDQPNANALSTGKDDYILCDCCA